MRGKDANGDTNHSKRGITPAHAGKRGWYCSRCCNVWDHPRACGEKKFARLYSKRASGSPPRMRGKESQLITRHKREGITPAHAGKSFLSDGATARCRDHPRACGEKALYDSYAMFDAGSPPRMRGKVIAAMLIGGGVGITPAHAGKRYKRNVIAQFARDHPRACGEKITVYALPVPHRGSPPRMRGKVWGIPSIFAISGITPAHAGKRRT